MNKKNESQEVIVREAGSILAELDPIYGDQSVLGEYCAVFVHFVRHLAYYPFAESRRKDRTNRFCGSPRKQLIIEVTPLDIAVSDVKWGQLAVYLTDGWSPDNRGPQYRRARFNRHGVAFVSHLVSDQPYRLVSKKSKTWR